MIRIQSYLFRYSVVSIVVPVLVIAIASTFSAVNYFESGQRTENKYLLSAVVGRIEEYLSNIEDDTILLSRMINDSNGQIEYYLEQVNQHRPDFFKLQFMNNMGITENIYPREDGFIGLDNSGQEFFRYPYASRNTYWAPILYSDQLDRPVVTFSAPVAKGVLTVFISLDRLLDDIKRLFPDSEVEAFITDQRGVYIVHRDINKVFEQQRNFDFANLRNEYLGEPIGYQTSIGGADYIGLVSFITDNGWMIFIGRDRSVIFDPLLQFSAIMLTQLIVLVGVSILISNVMGKQIISPLGQIVNESSRISRGDYRPLMVNSPIKEFNNLVTDLDLMVGKIKDREVSILNRERRFAMLFNNEALGAVLLNSDCKLLKVNKRWLEICETTEAKLLVEGIFSSFEEKSASDLNLSIKNQLQHNSGIHDLIVNMHNHKSWGRVYLSSVKEDSGEEIIFLLMEDITERWKRDEENKELRDNLKKLIDSIPMMLFVINQNSIVTTMNSRASDQSTSKDGAQDVSHMFPQFSRLVATIKKKLETSHVVEIDKILIENNGQAQYCSVRAFKYQSAEMEYITFIIDDISSRINMEEMMIQSEKMLSVGGLAAGMAHEINNPLGAIMQSVQVIQKRLFDNLPKNISTANEIGTDFGLVQEYIEARGIGRIFKGIIESGQRAAEIVTSMLSFSRQDYSGKTLNFLTDLVDQTIDLAANDYDLKKQYDFRKIEIEKNYEKDLPKLPCQGTKIQQVILNLLKNGAQAMGVAGTPNPKFYISIQRGQGYQQLIIRDNGSGMDEIARKRVFEPFYTTKEPGIGTGLGLAVSYFIITEQHSGMMTVESSPGEGALFNIRLPEETS